MLLWLFHACIIYNTTKEDKILQKQKKNEHSVKFSVLIKATGGCGNTGKLHYLPFSQSLLSNFLCIECSSTGKEDHKEDGYCPKEIPHWISGVAFVTVLLLSVSIMILAPFFPEFAYRAVFLLVAGGENDTNRSVLTIEMSYLTPCKNRHQKCR